MRFTRTGLPDAWLIEPLPFEDERGSFARTFCEREFSARGLTTRFVQHSLSHSLRRGTLRGMHFQTPPHQEVKLVSCIRGAIFDVVVDLREGSATYGQWAGFELSEQNRREFYIPQGFAHGFQTLTDDATVSYLISEFYTPDASTGVRYDDPAFDITWPLKPTVMSEKDGNWPLMAVAADAEM